MMLRGGLKLNHQLTRYQTGFQNNLKCTQRQKYRVCTYCTVAVEQVNNQSALKEALPKKQLFQSGGSVQAFDYGSLVANHKDIKKFWLPAKIEKLLMCDQWTWAFNLRTLDRHGWLYLCWHPQSYHICASTIPPPRGDSSELFKVLDKVDEHIHGLVLDDIQIPREWERVCRLIFRVRPNQLNNNNNNNGDGQSDEEPVKKMMYFEGQGKYSNVILANPDDRILVVGHQVGKGQSGMRQLQVGGIYELPPEQADRLLPTTNIQLSEWSVEIQRRGSEKTILDAMVNTFAAVSIAQAKEVCRWSEVQTELLVDDISEDQWSNLFNSWIQWIQLVQDEKFASQFTSLDDNTYSLYQQSTNGMQEGQLLGDSIREYYGLALEGERYEQLRQSLLKQVRNSIKKTESKIYALQQQIEQAEEMEAIKKKADLLMANAYRYEAGMEQIEVEDWESGEKVVIAIDDDSTLIETAERLFKRARKYRKAEENVQPLLEATKENLTYLQSVEENIILLADRDGSEEDWTSLRGIREELVDEGFMKAPSDYSLSKKASKKNQKSKTKNKTEYARSMLRVFETPRGLVVLVGRNNVQNDELSLRIANKADRWFHARGVPGAHVVLRIPAGEAAEEEDILFAADIAAYFSKAQMDGKVQVTTTEAQHVRKAPGGKPGMVKVMKEEVVVGRPDNVTKRGLHQQEQN